jgi:RimJ/RimL family protein N-acetyltransferase
MNRAPERIETERLVLRRPRAEDAAAIFERYAADRDVTRYLGWPRHETIEATRAFLDFSESEWNRWPAGPYLIQTRDAAGLLLGSTGLMFVTPMRAATGYVLASDSWRRGYATEALQAVVEVARGAGVVRLYALCHVEHSPSYRVLEKCGFAREGILRSYGEFPNLKPGDPQDTLIYAIILR